MADTNKKVQIQSGVDATGAKKGFQEIKDAGKEMSTSVQQSTGAASKGVEGLGAASNAAATKLERSTSSMVAQIQRLTAEAQAGSKNTPDYFNARAKQLGIDPAVLQPYLKDLQQVQRAQQLAQGTVEGMGMSAKATAAALRQVPAQFTDIITSLQGGQKPLNVLLQQGGQLKDVFGGVGPAVRALGGYVIGLVNPLTLSAAAVAGLTYAFIKGSDEQRAFQRTLILTGNAAGTTASQLARSAAQIAGGGTGTQSRAAEVLNDMARSGQIAARSLSSFTETALRFEKAGGDAAEQTVKNFERLAKDPLAAARQIDQLTNAFSRSTLAQIRNLEQQGRTTEAAKVAQQAYADALDERTPQILKNQGLIEKGWNLIKGAAKAAGDGLLDIGRAPDPIKQAQDAIAALDARTARRRPGQAAPEEEQRARAYWIGQLKSLQDADAFQQQINASIAVGNRQKQLGQEWDDKALQYLTREQQLRKEIDKARNEGAAAGIPQADIDKRVAAIRERLDPGSRTSGLEGQVAATRRQLELLTSTYANAETVLESQRKAGIVNEADYYAMRRELIERDRQAQVKALQEGTAQEQQRLKLGAGRLSTGETQAINDKILDNATKIREVNEKAAVSASVLAAEQQVALNGVARAYQDARLAAEDYLTTQIRAQRRELELFGESGVTRQIAQGRDQIGDKYSADRQRILNERALTQIQQGGTLTSDQKRQFDDLLNLNAGFQTAALSSYEEYVQKRIKLEGDWRNGAAKAFKDYIDDAANVAKQTEQLFTNAFQGLENAITVSNGRIKVNFSGLIDSIEQDLLRLALKQALIAPLKAAALAIGIPGFAHGGVFDPSGEVKRFALGDVFNQPTPISYGGGKRGEIGEAGPEAVMPLARGAGGKLGVMVHGGGQQPQQIVYAPSISIDGTADRARALHDAELVMRRGQREFADMLKARGVI